VDVLKLLRIILIIAWPFLVYFGLGRLEPRHLALLIVLVMVLRRETLAKARGLVLSDAIIVLATLALVILIFILNSPFLLLMYPVVVSLALLAMFGLSVINPPTIVERIARTEDENLPEEAIVYTKKVTLIWCLFFAANAAIATVTALLDDRKYWLFYNGFLSYILVATIFVGEYLVRRRILGSRRK
jgi:uncharacterized membrane protein